MESGEDPKKQGKTHPRGWVTRLNVTRNGDTGKGKKIPKKVRGGGGKKAYSKTACKLPAKTKKKRIVEKGIQDGPQNRKKRLKLGAICEKRGAVKCLENWGKINSETRGG